MKMKSLTLTLICVLSVFLSTGQETLGEKYQNLMETTETWEQYKMIPRVTIDAFWSEVTDSLASNSSKNRQQFNQIASHQATIADLRAERDSVQSQLDESLTQNDSIRFFGTLLSKTTYHAIVWSLIVLLIVGVGATYMMFLKSNRVTNKSTKELQEMQLELETHKNQSREKQVKLKRELQTALNTIDELKRGRI